MSKRVVITGIGPVTSIGIGKDSFFRQVIEHKSPIRKVPPEFELNYRFKSRHYIPAPLTELTDHGISSYYKRLLQPEDKISVIGAKLALADAGFEIIPEKKCFHVEEIQESSIIIGTGFSGLETAFQSLLAHNYNKPAVTEIPDNTFRFNKMVIPATMPNSIAAWISILYKLYGDCHTINASCASGTIAIGEAFRRIRDGYDKVVITGGVEYLKEDSGGIMRGFDVLGALTNSINGSPEPFSKRRSGFLFAEGGGCILILEELEHAINRGIEIYAEIVSYYSNSDAYNIVQIEKSGKQIIRLLNELTDNRKIDYLNSHGTGTIPNDDIEIKAIIEVFGDKDNQPKINSLKGILGHTLGASGALETAITAMSIKEKKIFGNRISEPVDNFNIALTSEELQINYAISTSYGFGGHNAGLLLKKWEK